MDKKLVCPADGRSFKTKAALAQHRRDAHKSGSKAPAARARKSSTLRRNDAAVAEASSVRTQQADSARMTGTDLIHSYEIRIGDLPAGTVVASELITPGSFRRLARVASAYQRIHYTRLRFRVVPQLPTTSGGGYVAGFVRDPADEVPDVSSLLSQTGAVATKWWQSCDVLTLPDSRLYYTSEGSELREFSPGRFMVISNGTCTANGSVVVYADWDVRLSGAGLESPRQLRRVTKTRVSWWVRVGHQGFWTGTSKDASSDMDHLIDGAELGHLYRLTTPALVHVSTYVWKQAFFVKIADVASVLPIFGGPSDPPDKTQWPTEDGLVLPAGTVLEDVTPEPVFTSGEVSSPSLSGLPTTTADLSQLLLALKACLSNSKQVSIELTET